MRDRRQSERLPSILEGRIVLGREAPHLQCTLRDISSTGARIWLPAAIELPQQFELLIPALEQTMPVQLMWSNGKTHGVMFQADLQGLSDSSDDAPDDVQPPEPPSALAGVPKGLIALTESVLADARQQLAEILEMPAEKIRLRLDIDP
ncbi:MULTISPECIES: PilZ domain-containing protein [Microvirga]|uniref:PilZ domain-containing protein n=1 Tax=Microvirga TaxID=186650 RepID=UPI0021C6CD13|nr:MULTISPECIES: PilZ domain-containing protein [unclassified Microvirga]